MSSTDTPGTPETPVTDAAADAKARREARKARILGAGSDRLARITKTGRGSEAETLYSSPSKPLGGNSSSGVAGEEDEVMRRANAALQGATGQQDDDPQDIDISQANNSAQSNPFLAMMNQHQSGRGAPGQSADMPQDLNGMMRAMQEAMLKAGGPGNGGAPMEGGMPSSAFPFGGGGAGMQTAMAPPPTGPPSRLDAVFNLLRLLVFGAFGAALVYGATLGGHADAQRSVPEKANDQVLDRFEHMSTMHRWARLAYERPAHWEARYFGIETFGLPVPQGVPVFWLFITLEIGLQSMRIMLQRRRPPPPGILLKVASFIPSPPIQLLLRTLASYLPLLDAFINDVAVVVFTIGCAIMYASWRTGVNPFLVPSDGSPLAQTGYLKEAVAVAQSFAPEAVPVIPM